jgi:hypothetical protein
MDSLPYEQRMESDSSLLVRAHNCASLKAFRAAWMKLLHWAKPGHSEMSSKADIATHKYEESNCDTWRLLCHYLSYEACEAS